MARFKAGLKPDRLETMQLELNAKAQSRKDAKEEGEKMAPRPTTTIW